MVKRTFFTVISLLLLPVVIYGAEFNAMPSTGKLGLKQEFAIDIKIDSAGQSINAAQAKIQFPPQLLEIKSVSKEGSVFNFWLKEPVFSNTEGKIEFIGGTPNAVSGNSLQVLRITFAGKGAGVSDIAFADAAVTAADESGTNVLSKSNGARLTISSVTVVSSAEREILPTPVPVVRTPKAADGLPATPQPSLVLYPDQDKWYNVISNFLVSWELPPDISGVNTAVNDNPLFESPPRSEGIFEAKTFPALEGDGIRYVHIRFQNNRGWGKTAHYKVQIDTQPPLPFKIDVKTGLSSDNPSPVFALNAADALSGIGEYIITVNEEEPVRAVGNEYQLPPHKPGGYLVSVKALDMAGNGIESSVELEIIPIERPIVTSITERVTRGTGEMLVVKGTAIPGSTVAILIEDENGALVIRDRTAVGPEGQWEFKLDRELRSGRYFVTAQTEDQRGAVSVVTDPVLTQFVDKPVVSVFGVGVTAGDLIWLLTALVIAVAVYYSRKIAAHILKTGKTAVFIGRDLKNILELIKTELGKVELITNNKKLPPENKNVEYLNSIKKISSEVDKIDKYIKKDIEELK